MRTKSMVLRTFEGDYFKGYETFSPVFTKNRKEAKRYPKENLEMLDDCCSVQVTLSPAYYCNGEFVHKPTAKKNI